MTAEGSRGGPRAGLRPDQWLHLALVSSLPIVWPYTTTFFDLVVTMSDFVFVGAALAWILAVVNGRTGIRWSPFYRPLGLYFGAILASVIASADPGRSAVKLCAEAYLIGLAVLTFNLVTSLSLMRETLRAWLVGTGLTVFAGLLGIGLFYLGLKARTVNPMLSIFGSLPHGDYPRIQALFANPNMLCTFLVVSLMFVLAMRALRWLGFWSSCVLTLGIWITSIFTASPGLGGLFLSTGFWIWVRLKRTRATRVGQWCLAGSGLVALVFLAATTISPVSLGHGTLRVEPSSRVLAWQSAFATFRRQPLFGRGVGMEVASVHSLNVNGEDEYVTDAHNVWLSLAGQEGILGLLAFASIVYYLVRGVLPIDPSNTPHAIMKTALAAAFLGGFLYPSLSGSFENTRHVWILFGLLAAVREDPG